MESGWDTPGAFSAQWLKFHLINIGEEDVGSHITHQKDGADDGESQLAHTFAEKHDAHEWQEHDQNEQYAQAPRSAGRVKRFERSLGSKREVAEMGYDSISYSPFTDSGDEPHKR